MSLEVKSADVAHLSRIDVVVKRLIKMSEESLTSVIPEVNKKTLGAVRKYWEIENFRKKNESLKDKAIQLQIKKNRALKKDLANEIKSRIEHISLLKIDSSMIEVGGDGGVLRDRGGIFNYVEKEWVLQYFDNDLSEMRRVIAEKEKLSIFSVAFVWRGRAVFNGKVIRVIWCNFLRSYDDGDKFVKHSFEFRNENADSVCSRYDKKLDRVMFQDCIKTREFLIESMADSFAVVVDLNICQMQKTSSFKKFYDDNNERKYTVESVSENTGELHLAKRNLLLGGDGNLSVVNSNSQNSLSKFCNKTPSNNSMRFNAKKRLSPEIYGVMKKHLWLVFQKKLFEVRADYDRRLSAACNSLEIFFGKSFINSAHERFGMFIRCHPGGVTVDVLKNDLNPGQYEFIRLVNKTLIDYPERERVLKLALEHHNNSVDFLKNKAVVKNPIDEGGSKKDDLTNKLVAMDEGALLVDLYSVNDLEKLKKIGKLNSVAESASNDLELHGGSIRKLLRFFGNFDRAKLYLKYKHPNFADAIDHIFDELFLNGVGDKRIKWSPVILVGSPSIGKTEFSLAVASMFNLDWKVIDFANVDNDSTLGGSDKHWSNSQPGKIFELLSKSKYANGVVVLDELDKASTDTRHLPTGPLHSLLEDRTAKIFEDKSIGFAIDASHLNWIATANTITTIPDSILSRFTVIEVPDPSPAQRRTVAGHIYKRFVVQESWGRNFERVPREAVLDALAGMLPREQKRAIKKGFITAIKAKRNFLLEDDIQAAKSYKRVIGFSG